MASDPTKPSAPSEGAEPGPNPSTEVVRRPDRRALLKVGSAAAPVLLTIASGPVAATSSCVVASSFVSVATFKSRNPNATVIRCTSRTANDWRNACIGTPTMACIQPLVSACFGGTTGSTYDAKSLYQVMTWGSSIATTGELGVVQHLTAMSLCISQGFASAGAVSQAYLTNVWQNYKANGNQYRHPSTGITWSSDQLIAWLRYQLEPIALPA